MECTESAHGKGGFLCSLLDGRQHFGHHPQGAVLGVEVAPRVSRIAAVGRTIYKELCADGDARGG